MLKPSRLFAFVAALACGLSAPVFAQDAAPQGERGPGVPEIWVRPGYRVTLAAENFGESRFLEFDANGTLYVSQPNKGNLTALTNPNADGVYQTKTLILEGYHRLHGLCLGDDGYMYFTETGAIHRFKPSNPPAAKPTVETIIPAGQLPADGGHWYRSILVHNGYLFTSIGDSGNLTDQNDTDRQKIWRFKTDGTDKTLWCTGIRNTEKLRFRPGTTSMYGCDHGSDNFGARYGEPNGRGGAITDVNPPCEFNRYSEGLNYGHPFVTGLGLPRPEFANRPDIVQLVDNNTAPAWCFGAHNAPNGWNFLTSGTLIPKNDALVALHGSWNSRIKVGYRVEHILFDDQTNKCFGAQPLVTTLNPAGTQSLARPVDVAEAPDGSALVSDDQGNKIFRISKVK